MNFDGKAFVKNISAKNFVSVNDSAFVRDTKEELINFNSNETLFNFSFVLPVYLTNEKEINIYNKLYTNGLIPYTIQVYDNNKKQELDSIDFIITRDSQIHEEQFLYYKSKNIYVSSVQPTNIKYNPKSAIVYDSVKQETEIIFSGVSVNVNNKVEITIPDKISNYTDMSIVVQKNCFIEIKTPDNVSEVINIPEDLTYSPGYIKGTFTKSGECNIKIKYPDGEQILNIIVPYYQRLL